jgi:adenosylhomocysteine nucleosidase
MSKRILILCALPEETQGLLENYFPTFYTGVGKINATMTATRCIIEHNPDLIINFGTGGSKNIVKHTLVDCTKFIQRDMNISELGFEFGVTPYDDDPPLMEFALDNPINSFKTCGSGDTFVSDMSSVPADVVDMEAYAIAKCCYRNNVDFVSFKYITDGADGDAATDWLENCEKGAAKFLEIIEYYFE